jgi:hypothetical protein
MNERTNERTNERKKERKKERKETDVQIERKKDILGQKMGHHLIPRFNCLTFI